MQTQDGLSGVSVATRSGRKASSKDALWETNIVGSNRSTASCSQVSQRVGKLRLPVHMLRGEMVHCGCFRGNCAARIDNSPIDLVRSDRGRR